MEQQNLLIVSTYSSAFQGQLGMDETNLNQLMAQEIVKYWLIRSPQRHLGKKKP